ncbi:hypothetical protein [Enterococcus sp. CWB-B31]|uniref:hypothetical protein n=1 Tax=Enterococcus sp. CWB-B31 TaxID=2885159 RepID=UPI001E4543E6|nr:hypothetical protein [Enterococcus sp. CWB-B31]MCB5954268.1 hypothetical protein [Enterococcus sp. CWB-B31]
MIVKAVSNKDKRDITINKLYPVVLKENEVIRIVDDFGGLSIYKLQDFKVYKENISSYNKRTNSLVYNLVDYATFLENYYNNEKKAVIDLSNSQLNIFEEDLNSDELVELIISKDYSSDEKVVFIEAIENKITKHSVKVLAKYFQNVYDVEPELLLSICKLLSKYQNQEVYDLFLKYISDDMLDNGMVQNMLVEYFNNCN